MRKSLASRIRPGENFKRTGSVYDCWADKYGQAIADELLVEYRQTMQQSIAAADMSHQRDIARSNLTARNLQRAGKSYEEIYGKEKSVSIKERLSTAFSGEKNPAFGKVYALSGRSVKGHYKGHFFRSLLEYSFMKHLESIGRSLDTDVEYETILVPYELDGTKRSYRIDFYDKVDKIIYEVKPLYVLNVDSLTRAQRVKWDAAVLMCNSRGLTFKVVTERDFEKVKFDVAVTDVDVVWIESTFRHFKRGK